MLQPGRKESVFITVTHGEWKSSKSGRAVSKVGQYPQTHFLHATGRQCPDAKAENKSRWLHDNTDGRVFLALTIMLRDRTILASRLHIAKVLELSGDRELSYQVPFNNVDIHVDINRLQCVHDFLQDVDHCRKTLWRINRKFPGDAFHGRHLAGKTHGVNSAGP